jgi:uncharacterized membrane protein
VGDVGEAESVGRRRGRLALAALFVVTGILHFAVPDPYVRIIPRLLPGSWARPLVYASGAAELVAAGLLAKRRQGWWVVALLVLVFPANVQMALDDPNVLTIGRLPLQLPMVWAAWPAAARPARRPRS